MRYKYRTRQFVRNRPKFFDWGFQKYFAKKTPKMKMPGNCPETLLRIPRKKFCGNIKSTRTGYSHWSSSSAPTRADFRSQWGNRAAFRPVGQPLVTVSPTSEISINSRRNCRNFCTISLQRFFPAVSQSNPTKFPFGMRSHFHSQYDHSIKSRR